MADKKFSGVSPVGLIGLGLALVAVAALLWAAQSGLVGARGSKAPHWQAASFAELAWLASAGLVASLVAQLRGPRFGGGLLALLTVAGLLAFGTGFAVVGVAWAGERQNYWDAVHFTSLVWLSIVGAISSVFAAVGSAKAGSEWGRLLQGPAYIAVGLLCLAWLWTWCGPLQELQADIARYFFLALHG